MTDDRRLILAVTFWPTGSSPSGWRVPEADNSGVFDRRLLESVARTAERGVFDYLFLGNSYASDATQPGGVLRRAFQLNGFAATSFAAAATEHLGVVATINTTLLEPYHVAQIATSIEHLSAGRFGINIVTGVANDPSYANFSLDEHPDTSARYARATEFLDAFEQLQDSWADDWLVDDRDGGTLFDPTASRPVDFRGDHFRIAGPLNAPRPRQGRIPIVQAGSSEQSFALGARFGDVRFAPFVSLDWNRRYVADRRAEAAALGRDVPERVVAGATFYPGETLAEARALYRAVEEGVVEEFGPQRIEATFGIPASEIAPHRRVLDVLDLDAAPESFSLGENATHAIGAAAVDVDVRSAFDAYGSDDITFLDLFRFLVNKSHFPAVVGDRHRIADWIEEGFSERAFDGVKFFPPFQSGPFERFVDDVVPELQRRGLARSSYETTTLRGHLGLERPRRREAAASTAPPAARSAAA